MNDTIFDAWQKHLDVDEKKGSETQQARARVDHMPLRLYINHIAANTAGCSLHSIQPARYTLIDIQILSSCRSRTHHSG